jgi:drug/metabolite transporter (DMT)-like permease
VPIHAEQPLETSVKNKGSNVLSYLYIAGCIVFTVVGQLLIKRGASLLPEGRAICYFFMEPCILAGLASAVIASMAWMKAIQRLPLSHAYPFMSLSFPIVAILASVLFQEPVKINQWIGLGVILLGLYIGSL